ncbi:MAG: TerC/Alx family metal homeostasis membrane protein [Candidatus Gracilibacteria bacterium]
MSAEGYLFIVFGAIILGFLVIDLGFFDRKAHVVSFKTALLQSIFWIVLSLVFAGLVFAFVSPEKSAEFLSAYLTEKMLSVDNLFVIMLLFTFFNLEEKYHHKVLFWGILGAIVFRGIFITAGAVIISQFYWILYVFGVILIYTGIKLFNDKKDESIDFENNRIFKIAKKYLRFSTNHHGGNFTVRENGKLCFTVLFMIVLLVETTDILFAVDSIPAAFSISQDPFIVFTSNIFAVMGLRALFFLVENVLHRFHHLQKGLSFILVFIGLKMLVAIFGIHISSIVSLVIILLALGASLILSVVYPKKV